MFVMFMISIIIYMIAIAVVYHNLYNYDKQSKIKLIAIGVIITLILTVIICLISSNGIETNTNYIGTARMASIFLFAPINVIISLTYIANVLNKYKGEKIDENQMKKRILIFLVILVIIFIFEISYIKDFEIGILKGANK